MHAGRSVQAANAAIVRRTWSPRLLYGLYGIINHYDLSAHAMDELHASRLGSKPSLGEIEPYIIGELPGVKGDNQHTPPLRRRCKRIAWERAKGYRTETSGLDSFRAKRLSSGAGYAR